MLVIGGQALLLAFLLGKQLNRLDSLEKRLSKVETSGSDALRVDEERLRTLTERVGTLEQQRR